MSREERPGSQKGAAPMLGEVAFEAHTVSWE